jgi:hypothetical protein
LVKDDGSRAEILTVEDVLDIGVRCPRCLARITDGADWCSLCYADLRAARGRHQAAPTESAAEPASTAPARAVAVRHLRDHEQRADGIDAMLAMLAAESGPPLGVLPGRLGRSTGQRVGLMVGGVIACTVVIFGLMTLLGQLL